MLTQPKTALIIESDAGLLQVLSIMVENQGYHVVGCQQVKEAHSLISRLSPDTNIEFIVLRTSYPHHQVEEIINHCELQFHSTPKQIIIDLASPHLTDLQKILQKLSSASAQNRAS